MGKKGIIPKYIIDKADGTPIDPKACYLVLRLDTDHAARMAAGEYASWCWRTNEALSDDINACLLDVEDDNVDLPTVWRHGGGNPFHDLRKALVGLVGTDGDDLHRLRENLLSIPCKSDECSVLLAAIDALIKHSVA